MKFRRLCRFSHARARTEKETALKRKSTSPGAGSPEQPRFNRSSYLGWSGSTSAKATLAPPDDSDGTFLSKNPQEGLGWTSRLAPPTFNRPQL